MLWPKKNSCKEFDNEKKFLRLENSFPPQGAKKIIFTACPSDKRKLAFTSPRCHFN